MRFVFIGLLCAGLALGCGGGNQAPAPTGGTDSAANSGGTQDGNARPPKDHKPQPKPPEKPKINLP